MKKENRQNASIKILHILPTVEEGKGIGGAEKLILFMLEQIKPEKANFTIAYHVPSGLSDNERTNVEKEFTARGAKVEIFKSKSKFDLRAVFQLIRIIKNGGIDIIHSHQPRVDFFGAIASVFTGVPLVVTRHLSIKDTFRNSFKSKIFEFIDSAISLHFSYLVCTVSRQIADDLISSRLISEKKVKVVYNGIDSENIRDKVLGRTVRSQLGIPEKIPLVGIIARLNAQKGHEYFIRAASGVIPRNPQIRFLIVGDGPLRGSLEKLVAELKIGSSVLFAGYRTDVAQIISELDIVALSSLSEGLPVVILEAMALGKPIVSFSVGGVPEIVENGKTGLLVGKKDIKALTEAILELSADREKARLMGEAGTRLVKDKFSIEKTTEEYLSVYSSLLNRAYAK